VITTNLVSAVEALKNDEIVAIPTETVYGLAGNALSEIALKKIFALKKRPFNNPLILHIPDVSWLNELVTDVPDIALQLAEKFWPGPLTLVLKRKPHISDYITAGRDTVAIRIPNHPMALELLEKLDFPLAAPSANPFQSISPTCAQHVKDYFQQELRLILDGGSCANGIESTIIGFDEAGAVLLRHGSIPIHSIEQITGTLKYPMTNNINPEAPGMFSKHYAPKTPIYLTSAIDFDLELRLREGKCVGVLLFQEQELNIHVAQKEVLSSTGNAEEAARNLYAALQRLDQGKLDLILAQPAPATGLGISINDRLTRATNL
jgi:L-threonylcarbamoyladenylate synthase